MKRKLLLLVTLLGASCVNAQGREGPIILKKSVEIEIVSSENGLAMPNLGLVSTKDRTLVTNEDIETVFMCAYKNKDISYTIEPEGLREDGIS